jgi:hypothetical protein
MYFFKAMIFTFLSCLLRTPYNTTHARALNIVHGGRRVALRYTNRSSAAPAVAAAQPVIFVGARARRSRKNWCAGIIRCSFLPIVSGNNFKAWQLENYVWCMTIAGMLKLLVLRISRLLARFLMHGNLVLYTPNTHYLVVYTKLVQTVNRYIGEFITTIITYTICPADNATAGSLGRRRAGQLRFGFVAVSAGHIVYIYY